MKGIVTPWSSFGDSTGVYTNKARFHIFEEVPLWSFRSQKCHFFLVCLDRSHGLSTTKESRGFILIGGLPNLVECSYLLTLVLGEFSFVWVLCDCVFYSF
jgi:hypothetical protein